jgi:hypothetical protein
MKPPISTGGRRIQSALLGGAFAAALAGASPAQPAGGTEADPVPESAALAARVRRAELGFRDLVVVRRRKINPSHVYTYHVEDFHPGGGLAIATLDSAGGPAVRELVASPDGQILDCDLSADGRELVFSWRCSERDGYQVFVIGVDGAGLRRLTSGPHHNYNACWLPDGGIAFLSTRSSRFAYCWVSPVGVLHRMERDGSAVRPLSANIVNDFTPSVMDDGRVIYSRWEYVDRPAIPIQSLWTIHPDGTMLAGYFGNRVLAPATFMEARSIPGGTTVLCTLTSHSGPARGAIGIIDVTRGDDSANAVRNLTPWVEWGSPFVNWIPTYNGFEANILEVTPKAWGSPRSRLADLVLSGHPGADGRPRLALSEAERLRLLLWIDLNVPYYGTSETAYPDHPGCRQLYPADLDRTLEEVAARRCAECHEPGRVPRAFWTRLETPQLNSFLLAPLARSAGGTERCGRPVLATRDDPDYAKILRLFDQPLASLRARPRMDMPNARPAPVDRSCLGFPTH